MKPFTEEEINLAYIMSLNIAQEGASFSHFTDHLNRLAKSKCCGGTCSHPLPQKYRKDKILEMINTTIDLTEEIGSVAVSCSSGNEIHISNAKEFLYLFPCHSADPYYYPTYGRLSVVLPSGITVFTMVERDYYIDL